MLLAVLSASMLRPVELSRMVSGSPSSVTGLCSGAGIPPTWTHTHTHTKQSGQHRPSAEKKPKQTKKTTKKTNTILYTHTRLRVCVCKYTPLVITLSQPSPTTHRQMMLRIDYQWSHRSTSNTQTPTHTCHMAQRERDCQFFMSVTVQTNTIWP